MLSESGNRLSSPLNAGTSGGPPGHSRAVDAGDPNSVLVLMWSLSPLSRPCSPRSIWKQMICLCVAKAVMGKAAGVRALLGNHAGHHGVLHPQVSAGSRGATFS